MKLTKHEQNQIKKSPKLARGELARLAREYNIPAKTLQRRLTARNPWPLEDALNTPVLTRQQTGYIGRYQQVMQERGFL